MNSHLAPDFEVVKASTLQTVIRLFETSVRANTRNTLLASYQFAKSRNCFNLASIDSARTGRNTMAIDTGGIEITIALTAACRTTVASLGIRTRVAETCG